MYAVFWVAGARDGEVLDEFDDIREAITFAEQFRKEHENEFDPTCGGVAISDESKPDGLIEW